MSAAAPSRWRREMGYTPEEFASVLRRAFADWRLRAAATNRWRLESPEGGLSVELEIIASEPRRLGALVLPVLAVELVIEAEDAAASAGFLTRFERSFQKGGG